MAEKKSKGWNPEADTVIAGGSNISDLLESFLGCEHMWLGLDV